MAFSCSETVYNGIRTFQFKGDIDRDAELPIPIKTGDFFVDLDKVNTINSVGVRKWVSWIGALTKDCRVLLKNCHYPILLQIGTVRGFLPQNSYVISFYLTYFCEELDLEQEILFELDKNYTFDEITISEFISTVVDGKTYQYELDTLPQKTITFVKKVTIK